MLRTQPKLKGLKLFQWAVMKVLEELKEAKSKIVTEQENTKALIEEE